MITLLSITTYTHLEIAQEKSCVQATDHVLCTFEVQMPGLNSTALRFSALQVSTSLGV